MHRRQILQQRVELPGIIFFLVRLFFFRFRFELGQLTRRLGFFPGFGHFEFFDRLCLWLGLRGLGWRRRRRFGFRRRRLVGRLRNGGSGGRDRCWFRRLGFGLWLRRGRFDLRYLGFGVRPRQIRIGVGGPGLRRDRDELHGYRHLFQRGRVEQPRQTNDQEASEHHVQHRRQNHAARADARRHPVGDLGGSGQYRFSKRQAHRRNGFDRTQCLIVRADRSDVVPPEAVLPDAPFGDSAISETFWKPAVLIRLITSTTRP